MDASYEGVEVTNAACVWHVLSQDQRAVTSLLRHRRDLGIKSTGCNLSESYLKGLGIGARLLESLQFPYQ